MLRIVVIGILFLILLLELLFYRFRSKEEVAKLFLKLDLLVVGYLLGVASYPLFFLASIPTPFFEILLALGIYIFLSFLPPLSRVLFVRAVLAWVYLFLCTLGFKERPLELATSLRILHLVSLLLAFYFMGEVAVLAFLYILKEKILRSTPFASLAVGLPSLEGMETTIRFLRRVSLLALGIGMVSGVALGSLRSRMVLDFYTFFLPLLFFVLLGIELYARKGKRWGGRLATMAILVGSTFVLVWIMKWLELIPHRVPLP